MPGTRWPEILEEVSIYEAIIKTLLYFDIFHYPLKKEEVVSFLGKQCTPAEVNDALKMLVHRGYVYQFNEFYSVDGARSNVLRRVKGNELATRMLPLAARQATFIGQFPFVRSVMASGSISKGYMQEDSDLDFFIVTDPGRLWITRMLMVIYKRVFLSNSHKHFCINYFVTSDQLEIEEKNIFTATELATVIPLFGQQYYHDLMESNGWLMGFFPNYTRRIASLKSERKAWTRRMIEGTINALRPDVLDDWCMRLTQRRWEKLYRASYNDSDFRIAFKSKKSSSKNHPKHYQRSVTDMLEKKWSEYKMQFNVEGL
jgi:hypothetical protein